MNAKAYTVAQEGVTKIRSALLILLSSAPEGGMANADISRSLGLHASYGGRQQGHNSRDSRRHEERWNRETAFRIEKVFIETTRGELNSSRETLLRAL